MNTTDHILVIGLGSIGQRHFRNLKELGVARISVVSSRSQFPEDIVPYKHFPDLHSAFFSGEKFSFAFVCTPTARHSEDMYSLLGNNIQNIYLEKPVSHQLIGTDEIEKLILDKGLRVVVGYDLHYDPGMDKVRSLLEANMIGQIVGVNAVVGQYLPDWRPHEDYRLGMSASKERGGGVMLDLIHEIDYLRWLFGRVDELACFYSNTGALEIETEDLSHIICRFDKGVLGNLSLDYLQRELVRYCRITGTDGSLLWNLAEGKVEWITADGQGEYSYDGFERNDRFKQIIGSFLSGKEDDRLTTYSDALHSLEVVEAAKRSSQERIFIKLNQ